jgi:hypothetical protein
MRIALVACIAVCLPAPGLSAPRPTTPVDNPYTPHPLAGPFSSVAGWCTALAARVDETTGVHWTCVPMYEHLVSSGPTRAGSAQLVPIVPDTGGATPICVLVVPHGHQLWADEASELPCMPPPGHKSNVRAVEIEELAWRDVIASVPGNELVLRYAIDRANVDGDDVTRAMILCGAGASGKPRCTSSIPVESDYDWATQYHPTISAGGLLRFKIVSHYAEPDDHVYPLRFP